MAKKHVKSHTTATQAMPQGTMLGIVAVLGVLVVIGSFTIGFYAGKVSVLTGDVKAAAPGAAAAAPSAPSAPSAAPTADVGTGTSVRKGDKNAPVTIIEFSDFQCPFCARFYTQTLPQLDEEYIKTGKVQLYYRDFPLSSIHPNAQKAGEAGKCAADQDGEKFWAMHDKMFENYNALSIDNLKKWAGEIGLNQGEFDSCLDGGKMAAAVQKDFQEGQAAGVRGTPAFFINGKLVSGAQPFSVFQQEIEAALA